MNYSHYYEKKNAMYGMPKKREQNILTLIDNIKKKNVLDVGCSTGYFGLTLQEMGGQVIGIDISKSAIQSAKKNIPKALFVDLNKGNLPFKNKYFDVIIASEVIEHLARPINILDEAKRILKPNGYIIITTPNLMYWGNRIKFLMGKFRYEKYGVFDEGHIHFYTYSTLKEDLKKTNFTIATENHIYVGPKFLNKIKRKFPGLFAYQFVMKCKPKTQKIVSMKK